MWGNFLNERSQKELKILLFPASAFRVRQSAGEGVSYPFSVHVYKHPRVKSQGVASQHTCALQMHAVVQHGKHKQTRKLGLHRVKTRRAHLEVNRSVLPCIRSQPLWLVLTVLKWPSLRNLDLCHLEQDIAQRAPPPPLSGVHLLQAASGLKSKVDLNARRQVPTLNVYATQAISWQI